jgi:hypothetical protein
MADKEGRLRCLSEVGGVTHLVHMAGSASSFSRGGGVSTLVAKAWNYSRRSGSFSKLDIGRTMRRRNAAGGRLVAGARGVGHPVAGHGPCLGSLARCCLETNSNLVIVFHVAHNFFSHMLSQFSYTNCAQAFSRWPLPIPTCCCSPAMAMTMLVSNPGASSWTHLFLFSGAAGSILVWRKC